MQKKFPIAIVLSLYFLAITGTFAVIPTKPYELFDLKVWSKPINEQVVDGAEAARSKANSSAWGLVIGSIGCLLILRRRN